MNKNLLNTGIQHYIENNFNTDTLSVLLKKPFFIGVSQQELVQQLIGKQKANGKLKTWFGTKNIIYPPKLNLEQTSSEYTAQYKANLVDGKNLLDATGGFGVDSYFFAQKMEHVFHAEINPELAEIVQHNFAQLGVNNYTQHQGDGLDFLARTQHKIDWVYIDPSRRNEVKGKVFMLSDCLPDVPKNLPLLFNNCSKLLIKTSPLLDITNGLRELQFVKEIHVVAVKNEVKELLWVLKKDYTENLKIICANILSAETVERFSFDLEHEKDTTIHYSLPMRYLYEPNAAILKSGAFKSIGNTYQLSKLQEHTHLYTSDVLTREFPGRIFTIQNTIPYNKKEIKKTGITQANITTRNFPESVAQIRKKHKIKDGGSRYLFFTTNLEGKRMVLECKKFTPDNPI